MKDKDNIQDEVVETQASEGEYEAVQSTDTAEDGDVDLVDEDARFEDKLKTLREKLKKCDEEKRQFHEDLQSARAEFLNAKRMQDDQLLRDRERITVRHIEELLPLVDSFDMAMQDASWSMVDSKWRKGVEGIASQLSRILETAGVKPLTEINIPFNPHEHEALTQQTAEGLAPDTVIAILQKGYKIKEKIIRPAKVVVSK